MREILRDTYSLCPICLRVIPASRVVEGDNVYLEKSCRDHGNSRVLIWRDAEFYKDWGHGEDTPTPEKRLTAVAADFLNDRVVPWYEEHDVKLLRIITDRGTEYCGNRERHEYQLYLALEDIDHSKTKARSPQTNGICERFHKTIQDQFYAVAFRKKIYHNLDEIQEDVDKWVEEYNTERTHSGKYCFGKTLWQTFLNSKKLADDKMLDRLQPIDNAVREVSIVR